MGQVAVLGGPWVNPRHGRGQRDQVTALATRGTNHEYLTLNVGHSSFPKKNQLEYGVINANMNVGNYFLVFVE